jgi:hypothetical protein
MMVPDALRYIVTSLERLKMLEYRIWESVPEGR